MNNLKNLVYAEWIKVYKSREIWIIASSGVILILIFSIMFSSIPENHYIDFANKMGNKNPWTYYYLRDFFVYCFFISFAVSFLVYFIIDIENSSKSWYLINTLPFSKLQIYISKLIIVLFMVFILYFLSAIFMILSAYILSFIRTDIPFKHYNPNIDLVIKLFLKIYLCSFAIIILHFILHILFKNSISLCIILPLFSPFTSLYLLPHNFLINDHYELKIGIPIIAERVYFITSLEVGSILVGLFIFSIFIISITYQKNFYYYVSKNPKN